ncbi:pseudaminic acid synthase [Candidatus Magnetoovum chiemensis]|nr:pseudaminic acid synthase [Candidatus Magnetoovum chiemensis]
MSDITISNRKIGSDEPVFIIAEMSANHSQDFDIALDTVEAIKEAGADAVKFQTYRPDTITIDANNEYFNIKQGTIWDGTTLYELYKKAYMPWEWFNILKEKAESLGLICFSTPFDKTSVDFLDNLNVPAYKIASFEITDLPLIEYIAQKKKPIIISTGIATIVEIQEAVDASLRAKNNDIAIMKCTSVYPTPLEEVNLKAIPYLINKFKVPIGLSDHTTGILTPIAAVSIGAKIIEKHFILDKALGGPDRDFSLDPSQFKQMVRSIRNVERALGNYSFKLSEKVLKSKEHARSLFIVKDIKAGEVLSEENVKSIRPGYGLNPRYINDVLNKKAKNDIEKGTPLSWDLIE